MKPPIMAGDEAYRGINTAGNTKGDGELSNATSQLRDTGHKVGLEFLKRIVTQG